LNNSLILGSVSRLYRLFPVSFYFSFFLEKKKKQKIQGKPDRSPEKFRDFSMPAHGKGPSL
jgi:hypothetical protein